MMVKMIKTGLCKNVLGFGECAMLLEGLSESSSSVYDATFTLQTSSTSHVHISIIIICTQAIFNMLDGAGVKAKGDPKEKAHYFFKYHHDHNRYKCRGW